MTVQMVDTITNDPNNQAHPIFTAAWSSSDSTKATVNSSGLVTGKDVSPGVNICVAVLNPGYEEELCATVVVEVAPPAGLAALSRRHRSQGD